MQPLTASELEIWERIVLVMQRLRASAVSKSGEEAPEGPHPVPGPHQFPVPTPSPVPPPVPILTRGVRFVHRHHCLWRRTGSTGSVGSEGAGNYHLLETLEPGHRCLWGSAGASRITSCR